MIRSLPIVVVILVAACATNPATGKRQILPLARLLGSYSVPGLKAALNLSGYDVGRPRPPLAPVAEAGVKQLRDALAVFEETPA